jgi:4-amino-4-deoxy-L-arabinose transferase-like glycosyltransferase
MVVEQTGKLLVAWIPGVFLLMAPTFAFYSGNFLPDPVGASFTLIAYYYFLRYYQQKHFRDMVVAMLLFTLATLIKTSAGIYFIAATGVTFLVSYVQWNLFSRWQKVAFLGLLLLSLGLIIGYVFFNRWLNEVYNSGAFLMEARPIESWVIYDELIKIIDTTWLYEYFTPLQYWLLALCVLVIVVFGRYMVRKQGVLLAQVILAVVGGIPFFWLMGVQLAHHDYYIISPYMPVLTLIVALAALRLGTWKAPNWQVQGIAAVAIVALLAVGIPKHHARMNEPYLPFSEYYDYKWMRGGAEALAQAGVPTSAKIFVIGEIAPNIAPIYFDRRGIVWRPEGTALDAEYVKNMLEENGLDYVIVRRSSIPESNPEDASWRVIFEPVVSKPEYVVLHWRNPIHHW